MERTKQFYIDGAWVGPVTPNDFPVVNPTTEEPQATISLGTAADVDNAVAAAQRAFPGWRDTPPGERAELLMRLADIYEERAEEMVRTISMEMGAPMSLASGPHVKVGLTHLRTVAKLLPTYPFEENYPADAPQDRIRKEPIGPAGLITPWNWPMNQILQKVAAALAAGCPVILKPSELSPLSAMLLAEMVDAAGVPPGVFNLVNGEGAVVGDAMARHPKIRILSLTGSGRAGVAVTQAAAPTFKRVVLELGGKGANIIFGDSDIPDSVRRGTLQCFNNSGQSCNAPTRMLVENSHYEQAIAVAAETAAGVIVGDPASSDTQLGPLASQAQYERVQHYIETGMREGARLVAGGLGRPEGMGRGYYVRPTIFADVTSNMTIAREEIFGPVLCIMPFSDEDHAVVLANDTDYGLANFVQSGDQARAERVATRLEAGVIVLNGASRAPGSPFGGYKHSGNGREGGRWGLEEYLEIKAIAGWSITTR